MATLQKISKLERVKELKEKVRALCLQQEPSICLILLTLEELAKHSRKADAEDAEVYEELARQAIRHQAKVDVTSLCLSVLGGRAADAISKAISKCLKEKVESKNGDKCSKPEKMFLNRRIPLYIIYIRLCIRWVFNHLLLLIFLNLRDMVTEIQGQDLALQIFTHMEQHVYFVTVLRT
jgi:hypothetical protein